MFKKILVALVLLLIAGAADARHPLKPLDTSSPRETLQSFFSLIEEVGHRYSEYRDSPNPATQNALIQTRNKGWRLLDLSQVPPAARHKVAAETFVLLWEVIARLELPDFAEIPDASAGKKDDEEPEQPLHWRFPLTEITIAQVDEGPQAGEYLFSPDTVNRAREFYQMIHEQPYLRPVPVKNLSRTQQLLTGWMIPLAWVEALPEWANTLILEQVLWKWFSLLLQFGLALGLAIAIFRWTRRRSWDGSPSAYLRYLSTPLAILLLVPLLQYLSHGQINVTGSAAEVQDYLHEIVFAGALVWILWLSASRAVEAIIASPRINAKSLNAHLIRFAGRSIGILGLFVLVFRLANQLGIPVYGLVAGAGVGGIAIALAAKSTLENFMGTLNLFADRPVGIGDLCRYDEEPTSGWQPVGRVESIGLRSTKIRRLDRTMITIPNADFSQRHIVNLSSCDRFLLTTNLGLRYETTDDQLRFLLAELRELLHAHPKTIHTANDPVRVRFAEFGDYSLNVVVRVYIRTANYNEFLAIQEDILLRVMKLVKQAGTGFAFPSRTLYVTRDTGLDDAQQQAAEKQVRGWASAHSMPFPDLAEDRREMITDTLDYPPEGSPGADRG